MLLFRHPLKSPILTLKKNPITLLFISILLITAALTNPNTESHKKFMIIKLTKLTQQALPKSDEKMEDGIKKFLDMSSDKRPSNDKAGKNPDTPEG